MNFDAAFEKLLGHEGGYTGDMRDLRTDQAKAIYRALYWDAVRADELPPDVRFHIFDAAVNSGVVQAVRWLQRAVGAEADGVLGAQTLKAVSYLPASVIAARYSGHRLAFMVGLKTWPTFGGGWARRIAANLLEA